MKVAAIIAEYNPFHNGHAYQIAQLRKDLDVDRVVVLMSGNFVQRGTPAIFDKYTRTKQALAGGADLVLELPVHFALGSAEFFAYGAVSILNSLGCISWLHFGSECGDLSILQGIADILIDEPEIYKLSLQNNLKNGMNFPLARAAALQAYINSSSVPSAIDITATLSSPNNILAIEYLKALKRLNSTIIPVTLRRAGANYHEQNLSETDFPSATGLRSLYFQHNDISVFSPHMPSASWRILQLNTPPALNENHFSQMLHYKLLSESPETLALYQDITPDLARRIFNLLPEFISFEQFATLVKTRDITSSRVYRSLFHILLDIKKENCQFSLDSLYCRLLGFRKEASDLLKEIKLTSHIPMISKLADASSYLSDSALYYLKADLHATDIYNAALSSVTQQTVANEYCQEIIRY